MTQDIVTCTMMNFRAGLSTVYLEQKTIFNLNKWPEEFTVVIGAFDMEQQDLSMNVQKPLHGTLMFTDEKTTAPITLNCETAVNVVSEPCGNFSKTLPYNKDTVSWLYTTLLYNQSMNYSGFDLLKVYFSDSMNISSIVVTIQFILMESPCHNDGLCQPKNGSNYPCTSTYRAESFDLYYDCVCLPGYSGVYCEENIDGCLSSPCLDTLECIDGDNEYECRCPIDNPDCVFKETTEALNLGLIIGITAIVCILGIFMIIIGYKYVNNRKNTRNGYGLPDTTHQSFPMKPMFQSSVLMQRTASDDVPQSGPNPVTERVETEHQVHTESVPEYEHLILPQTPAAIGGDDIDTIHVIVTEQNGQSHGESDDVQQSGTTHVRGREQTEHQVHTELQNTEVINDDVSENPDNGNTNARCSTSQGVRGRWDCRVHPAPPILKSEHSLIGKNLQPMILDYKSSVTHDLSVPHLYRLKENCPLTNYSLGELATEFTKLTKEIMQEVMFSAEKEFNLENAQQLLHQTIVYANEIGGPTESALPTETTHWVSSSNPGPLPSASQQSGSKTGSQPPGNGKGKKKKYYETTPTKEERLQQFSNTSSREPQKSRKASSSKTTLLFNFKSASDNKES
ncbi:uncharacterized protein LOC134692398 [Mytilus trossulus]|uniref:uncharacterized protein LOC134692398 n=1 Tax=Mytilus trossulus TaxID=6551 RepID=UPI003006D4FE